MSNAMNAASPQRAAHLMRLATYASVSVACVLVMAKLAAWMLTDSVSLMSTLIDSVVDAGASLVNLLAVRQALQPADREHRFGHGKAEPLAGLAQAAFICGSAGFLMVEAIRRLLHPSAIMRSEVGLAVMAFSIALTVLLVVFQLYVIKRTSSVAISADSLHYRADLLVNAGVMLSIVLVAEMGWLWADPVIAIIIGGYILKGAWMIGVRSYDLLMDHEVEPEVRKKLRAIAEEHPKVCGIHDMRTRSSGPGIFVEMHLEMDGNMRLWETHDVAEEVMAAVMMTFPNAEVIVHQDPEGIIERRLDRNLK